MDSYREKDSGTAEENEPLISKSDQDTKLRIQPRRTFVVEPLLVLYALGGMPLMALRSQYMYQKIASDMGIDIKNLSSKFILAIHWIVFPIRYRKITGSCSQICVRSYVFSL